MATFHIKQATYSISQYVCPTTNPLQHRITNTELLHSRISVTWIRKRHVFLS